MCRTLSPSYVFRTSFFATLLAGVPMGYGQLTFDGTVNFGPGQEWDNPEASAVQTNYAGFGNQIADDVFQPGSELDQLFIRADASTQTLYVGVTGNLEQGGSGNAILVLFDTRPGGQTTLTGISAVDGPPFAFQNMENDVLEAGFEVDYVLHLDAFTGTGFVSWYEVTGDPTPGATRIYRGSIALSNGDNTLEGGTADGLSVAFNNTNVSGVTGDSVADVANATTGLEAAIPFAHLGLAGLPAEIKVQVILLGGGGFVSNQSLPPLEAGTPNLGNGRYYDGSNHPLDPALSFQDQPGTQVATVSLTDTSWSNTIDGQNIPADFTGGLIATQANPTSFGDQIIIPGIIRASEIDQMLVREDAGYLLLGITGNLHYFGQNLVIFLDTLPEAGETLLADNQGRISGNNGDTLPCAADFALVLNIWDGTMFADFVDLGSGLSTYLGSDPVNTGDGILEGGAGAGWTIILNSDNVQGVTDNPADDPQTANALTATTGWEIAIPLVLVGDPPEGTQIGLIAMITGENDDRFIANQILPALPGGGQDSPGNGPEGAGANLAALGYECLTLFIGEPPPVCNEPRFDADADGDVDQEDFGLFQACYTGAGPFDLSAGCACFDWNLLEGDGDIDQEDYGAFQLCAASSGPTIPADPACDDPPAQ